MVFHSYRLAGTLAVVLLASSAPGPMDPHIFAQRCQVPELADGLSRSSLCRMPDARLGLGGPTIVPREAAGDVEVTGGISMPSGTAERPGTAR